MKPMNILIVDDQPTDLKLLRAQLEAEGHVVFEAHDGVDALALLERQRVDAVISDILMPRMDGYRLCHEIRKHARLRDLPIIIHTATYTSPGDAKLALEMGANKYLMKPVSVEILVAALHEVIAQPYAAPRADALREIVVLKEYNERLVSKLLKKNTELHAQAEALRASERKFQSVFEQAAAGVIIDKGPWGQFVNANRRFCEMVGYSAKELLQLTAHDITHPDDIATDIDQREQISFGIIREFCREKRYRRKDGSFVWAKTFVAPLDPSEAKPTLRIGVIIDITERKRGEEALHKSHEDYRRVIEDIFKFVPEPLLVFTGNLNLFKDNQAFEDLLRTHAPKLNYTEPELRETLLQGIRAKVLSGDAGEIRIPPKNRDEQGTRGPDHSGEGAEPAAPPIPGLS
jgi:PAS domain S-box-containing protein